MGVRLKSELVEVGRTRATGIELERRLAWPHSSQEPGHVDRIAAHAARVAADELRLKGSRFVVTAAVRSGRNAEYQRRRRREYAEAKARGVARSHEKRAG